MKKIFTLLTIIALNIGSIWADFGIGVNSTPTWVQMQATTTSASCSTYKVTIFATNNQTGATNQAIVVVQSVSMNSATSIKGTHYFKVNSGSSSWFVNSFTSSGGAVYLDPYSSSYPLSGNLIFTWKSVDANGDPIYTVNLTNGTGVNDYTYYTGGLLDNIVDLPVKVYKNDLSTRITLTDYYKLTVVSDNSSMGSVSGDGSASGGQYYGAGTSHTNLTASPNSSAFNFVKWQKNGADFSGNTANPLSVTLNANDTYTAIFEANAATEYTISTAVSPSGTYGSVSGAGKYYENSTATLTATSANDRYYKFDHWMKGSSTYAGGATITPTVTADATYTAVFRDAAAGTITTVAANGTVTGGGNYAGGAEVELGVTADDGYIFTQWSDGNTDNPRTVYVDGDKNYTAQFVAGVAINAENSVLYVWDSDGETPLESGGGSFFDFVCVDGDYTVQIESASTAFSTATFSGSQLEQTDNYTYLMYNGNKIALNYSQSTITFTANSEQYNKRKFYDVNATLVATNGTHYVITAKTIRAMNWDSDSDYREDFPKNDYNFTAPTYATSIWEYKNSSWSYSANSKWLTANVTISNYIYRIRLAFNVSTDYIPTGVYTLATGNGSLLSNYATPAYSYNTSAGWASEIDGSHVFQYGTGNDDNSYWWFLETGTISVVNTNGVYYVEVDALNSRGLPVRFTMGTPPVTNHTVSITAPTNGTITVSYNDGSAQSFTSGSRDIKENTVLTITAEGATGYHFDSWTNDGAASVTVNNDKTIGATFAPNAYTVTFNANGGSGESMASQAFTYGVAQNLSANTYTAPENKHFIGWATTAEGDVAYADGAEVSNLTATQNGEVELFAKWAYNTYTVVFNKNNEDATGTMANQAFTYGTAQNLTTNGFTLSGHDFAGWATEENGAVVYTNGEEVNNLTSVHEGTVNLYAKWIEIFVLRDDKEAGDTYYTTTYANKKAEGKKLNVQYNRSFTAGRWATFALPFGYSFRNRENPTFGGQVYYLISAKYEQRGEDVYLTLNCMPNTTGIEANKPYVLIPNGNITNPVFEDVKLKDIAENPYTASDMSGTGTIMFVNTTYRQRIDRADADENLRVIFLKNNTLCYPGGAVNMSAFRGYFYMMDDYMLLHGNQNAPVRVRLMTPDGEYIEQAPDTDQPAAVETKKYIENGILVIERAGMKYDAQGHIIK